MTRRQPAEAERWQEDAVWIRQTAEGGTDDDIHPGRRALRRVRGALARDRAAELEHARGARPRPAAQRAHAPRARTPGAALRRVRLLRTVARHRTARRRRTGCVARLPGGAGALEAAAAR